jgi:hypothetical protein
MVVSRHCNHVFGSILLSTKHLPVAYAAFGQLLDLCMGDLTGTQMRPLVSFLPSARGTYREINEAVGQLLDLCLGDVDYPSHD